MPTPRVSRSAGATPSGGAGAGRGETRSPPARRVSPRDRRADKKARSPAHARSPLAEIFGSPEAGAARRGSSLGGAREDKARRARAPSPEEEEEDETEAIMATQAAPCEAVGGDVPEGSRPGGDVFDRAPSGAPEETTPSATPLADPTKPGASAETATEAATRRLSERVYRDTGKRLAKAWTARYDGDGSSPSGASGGKRRRLWFVSPGGKRFDGPGKVSAFVSTPRAMEGTDFLNEGEGEGEDAKKTRVGADGARRRSLAVREDAPREPRERRGHEPDGEPDGGERKRKEKETTREARAPTGATPSADATTRDAESLREKKKKAATETETTETTPSFDCLLDGVVVAKTSSPKPVSVPEPERVTAGDLPRREDVRVVSRAKDLNKNERPGDAAARILRARLLSSAGASRSLASRPELDEHRRQLVEILGDTARGAQNNSVLLVGARGSGKTAVLNAALRELTATQDDAEKTLVVRLNGMLHGDERVGVREIARQLCSAGDELEFSRAAGFGENVAFMREVLRVLEVGGRAVVFVLEEFDLFAKGGAKSKQTLLYAVMDLLQQAQTRAAVVGVTSRHDAAEMLEKRVRSRFSFRRILIAPPVADVQAKDMFCDALRLDDTELANEQDGGPAEATVDVAYAKRFNDALDAAVATPAASEALKKVEALECTPRAVGDLACLVLSRMDRQLGLVTARDIASATQTLLADSVVESLAGCSSLELCLAVAMSRVHRFRGMPRFNFNHVENELRTMAANDFLGDAGRAKSAVLLRAFENLLAMGVCEAPGGGGEGSLGGGSVHRARGAAGAHKLFRGIQLLVSDEEVEEAVETHATKPAGLKELLTHEGVRVATGF
jgi:origin recognition complex subunit 4